MAEIISRKKGKALLRVDLTPMVDLGFLLITFFILTTSMQQPTTMKVNLPANGGGTKWGENKTLTLVLLNDKQVAYFNGNDSLHKLYCNYSNELRQIIQYKQNVVKQHFGNKNELLVLIQPTQHCLYKNVVDVLDEMKINEVKMYALL